MHRETWGSGLGGEGGMYCSTVEPTAAGSRPFTPSIVRSVGVAQLFVCGMTIDGSSAGCCCSTPGNSSSMLLKSSPG
jgi:hypothetical protein